MRFKLCGRYWTLRFAYLRGETDGRCTSPFEPHKEIVIRRSLKGQAELETLLHELWHASDWSKDEEWVGLVAEDTARLLYRLGWRRSEPQPAVP